MMTARASQVDPDPKLGYYHDGLPLGNPKYRGAKAIDFAITLRSPVVPSTSSQCPCHQPLNSSPLIFGIQRTLVGNICSE